VLPFRQLASGFKISHVHFLAFPSFGVTVSQNFGLAFFSRQIFEVFQISEKRNRKLKLNFSFP